MSMWRARRLRFGRCGFAACRWLLRPRWRLIEYSSLLFLGRWRCRLVSVWMVVLVFGSLLGGVVLVDWWVRVC